MECILYTINIDSRRGRGEPELVLKVYHLVVIGSNTAQLPVPGKIRSHNKSYRIRHPFRTFYPQFLLAENRDYLLYKEKFLNETHKNG